MRALSSHSGLDQISSIDVSLNPVLLLTMLMLSIGIIYTVGLEPLTYVHNAFHDLRHATGFPCH